MSSNEEYIRKNKITIVDDDKNTKLHYAAALGNLEEIKKIIASGQKLDPENYLGWTPLMMAVRNANFASMELLLQSGADATKKNKFGVNVFLVSVTCGDVDIVEKILNHLLCGGVSRQSLQKIISPLSLAILFKQDHIFKYLLERSFDPNAETVLTGITPVMFAAAMGNHKVINKLLQYKADINKKNYLGKNAQDILHSRRQKIDINGARKPKPDVPLIIVSPYNNSPQLELTSCTTNVGHTVRKSSNTRTPNMVCTPAITPIAPFIPQVFFGPNFTPTQFISPMSLSYHSNSFLNHRAYFSPAFPQDICPSNCS